MPTRPFPYLLATSHGALIVLVLYSVQAMAAPMRAECPATLSKTAIKVAPPVGWAGTAPDNLILAVAGMMGGPPDSELFLIPARQAKTKGAISATWDFEPRDEKWLHCGYGSVTGGLPVVQVGMRMDDGARTCTLTKTTQGKRGAYSLRCER